MTTAKVRKLTEEEKSAKRREFYRIVKERLDARFERGETYTSTKDLYKGYEPLHDEGFAKTQFIAASVAQVLGRAEYRDRLFYAYNIVSHRVERMGPGKSAAYRIYLRPDATPPKDYVLVPISAKKNEVAEYIAIARGAKDATPHVTQGEPANHIEEAVSSPSVSAKFDYQQVAVHLAGIVEKQAELLAEFMPLVALVQAANEPAEDEETVSESVGAP